MSRTVEISRSEAELLVDLLDASQTHEARDLNNYLRAEFGMVALQPADAWEAAGELANRERRS